MSKMWVEQGHGIWNGVERDDWRWVYATDGRETWDMGEPSETEEEALENLAILREVYAEKE